jgi:hypothetical protein
VIVKTEKYQLNKLVNNNGDAVDEELLPIDVSNARSATDTAGKKAMTKPAAVLQYEKKNSGKKKIKARDGRTGY